MRYQAVLFDFDGTLFDTEHDEMTALSALVTQATGVEPPKDKLLKTFGMTGPDGIRFLGCNEEQRAQNDPGIRGTDRSDRDSAPKRRAYGHCDLARRERCGHGTDFTRTDRIF